DNKETETGEKKSDNKKTTKKKTDEKKTDNLPSKKVVTHWIYFGRNTNSVSRVPLYDDKTFGQVVEQKVENDDKAKVNDLISAHGLVYVSLNKKQNNLVGYQPTDDGALGNPKLSQTLEGI